LVDCDVVVVVVVVFDALVPSLVCVFKYLGGEDFLKIKIVTSLVPTPNQQIVTHSKKLENFYTEILISFSQLSTHLMVYEMRSITILMSLRNTIRLLKL
jgi:hypothetical protein